MIETLVSVPPRLDAWLRASPKAKTQSPFGRLAHFVGSDPEGTRLGSGGGTVSLLHSAWRASQGTRKQTLADWLTGTQRLVLHAGGESRRLPAYAAVGKAVLPVPLSAGKQPARFDQVLADFQLATYRQALQEAGPRAAMMVASGDVWLEMPPLRVPRVTADIAGVGMRVTPEVAQHFGVFFVAKASTPNGSTALEQPIAFFRQKPSPQEIYRHAAKYDFFVDTGLWLFSAAAVAFLFRRCGWDERRSRFKTKNGHPEYLDLYTEIGSALGTQTRAPGTLVRHGWSQLTASVIPLDEAQFYHVGSSRQLLESYEQLAGKSLLRPKVFSSATPAGTIATPANSSLPVWIDGGATEHGWELDGLNVVCGGAPGLGQIKLRQEQCLEIAPTGARQEFVVRPYALDDKLRGPANANGTICGQDAATWLERRGFPSTSDDVFILPIYPVVRPAEITPELVQWFFATHPEEKITRVVHAARRISAAAIPDHVDFDRYFALRAVGHANVLIGQFEACLRTGDVRVFRQDFAAIATLARQQPSLRTWLRRHGQAVIAHASRAEHQSRMLMLLAELAQGAAREQLNRRAHLQLQRGVIGSDEFGRCHPRLALKEDQIVWGRSPVRLDLAGGWTDTPPYCLEHGGAVVNLAVLLNRQPPIQVFVRPTAEPVISLRSIDLGSAEVVSTYAGLTTYKDPRSGFSLPKAALAMAGFHPDFASGRAAPTLRARLQRFGGGLEISLLSAVPKGSGLGTSSILAATILGALNRACALGWDEVGLYNRVLGVEQLLTTGGGWQDQAGALFRGIKLIETSPGPAQNPSVRHLPQHLFGPSQANRTLLLYYTGITRLAKGILKEIVHDMFLSRFTTLQTLDLIRTNAHALFGAIQQSDQAALNRCIARSWDLNKQLDRGTTTPEIEGVLRRCGPDLVAAKLLGAGGGGYMLLCAATPEAGDRIRLRLEKEPPNRRARFIDFEIAESGLEVTVS
jgi:galactokinase/mevalonate kinase-like predicted kinase